MNSLLITLVIIASTLQPIKTGFISLSGRVIHYKVTNYDPAKVEESICKCVTASQTRFFSFPDRDTLKDCVKASTGLKSISLTIKK